MKTFYLNMGNIGKNDVINYQLFIWNEMFKELMY